ncbi:hypothetical protein [Rhodococcus aetherivorans]|uniref:hypothetical protein n=1 Tax=Rhodococcus aetherivorans TaxID=191292 RepID=UPI000AA70F31|nr:hypothetical protein [Rhodococcus aetherivorans]
MPDHSTEGGISRHKNRFIAIFLLVLIAEAILWISSMVIEVPSIGIIGGVIAVIGIGIAAATQISREELRSHSVSKSQILCLAIALVMIIVVGLGISVSRQEAKGDTVPQDAYQSNGALKSTSNPTSTDIRPGKDGSESPTLPLVPHHPCPSPGTTERRTPDIEICVMYWCMAPIFQPDGSRSPSTSQVKVRPKITNNSPQPLDLSIGYPSAVRLLIAVTEGEFRWDPPPNTRAAGDRPIRVRWQGEEYWAVPPNIPRDASPIVLPDGSRTYDGFATYWDATVIESGEAMNKPLRTGLDGRPIQEGDLVFQVPTDIGATLAGLAVVSRAPNPEVMAVTMYADWPPESNLNDF